MSIIEAIILGLVQGLTEFIPVSSSGHLLLAHEIFGSSDNSLGFDVALHVGTLLALVVYFWSDIWSLAHNLANKNAEGRLARLLIIATVPAAMLGLLLGDAIDSYARSPYVVAATLALVGVLMLVADYLAQQKDEIVSKRTGILVGFAQAAALIPGVSRSGATMTAGLFLGLTRQAAARFSFLLAIPIIAGSALGVAIKGELAGDAGMIAMLAGMFAAFISGLFAIKFMLNVIKRVGLRPFAIYRIVIAAVVLIFLL